MKIRSAVAFWVMFLLLACYGYLSNLFSVLHSVSNDAAFTASLVVRVVGVVVAPLGVVLGFV